jgi:hypothetical protein
MKNYSRKKAQKGRLAYRTPERFIYRRHQQIVKIKAKKGFL